MARFCFNSQTPLDAVPHVKLIIRSKTCLLFKGPGSFKKVFKIGGNVGYLKVYRDITHARTHPFRLIAKQGAARHTVRNYH
jgi:hypothetical protein